MNIKNMLKKIVRTIHDLKVFFLIFILFSFVYMIGINPFDLSRYLGAHFSSAVGIGSSASIPPNPVNTLALQLKEKENRLDARESQLEKRETDLKSTNSVLQNKVIWGMLVGIIILFVLILLNFILDWRRRRSEYNNHENK